MGSKFNATSIKHKFRTWIITTTHASSTWRWRPFTTLRNAFKTWHGLTFITTRSNACSTKSYVWSSKTWYASTAINGRTSTTFDGRSSTAFNGWSSTTWYASTARNGNASTAKYEFRNASTTWYATSTTHEFQNATWSWNGRSWYASTTWNGNATTARDGWTWDGDAAWTRWLPRRWYATAEKSS